MRNRTVVLSITMLSILSILFAGCAKNSEKMSGLDRADKIVMKLDSNDDGFCDGGRFSVCPLWLKRTKHEIV